MRGVSTRETYGEMVPMRRYGTPDEIADGILLLASAQASYITGQTLAIDGGFVAAGILVNELHDRNSAPKNSAKAPSGHSAGISAGDMASGFNERPNCALVTSTAFCAAASA